MRAGNVHLRQPTKFGSFPGFGDINIGYNLDWSIEGYYSWGSWFQPRVESVTEIVIKDGYDATIEFTNTIDMFTRGSISGNHDENQPGSDPWPQQARHNQRLLAIDVNGNSHDLKDLADSTAKSSVRRGTSEGNSETTNWSVSGGAALTKKGPGITLGGTYGQSSTYSQGTTRSNSVPRTFDVQYTDSNKATVTRKIAVKCGGTVSVSRASQISGDFLTRSYSLRGSIHNKSTNSVRNALKIRITCKPCSRPAANVEDSPSPPDIPPRKATTPKEGDPRYGSSRSNGLGPRTRNGVIYTPRSSDMDLGSRALPPGTRRTLANNPDISGGGRILLKPEDLPSFVEPFHQEDVTSPRFDPTLFNILEEVGQIPLIIRGEENSASNRLVVLGCLRAEARIEPLADTEVTVVAGADEVLIEGAFHIVDPLGGGRDLFPNGALIQCPPGTDIQLAGDVRIEPVAGSSLIASQLAGNNTVTMFQARIVDIMGTGGEPLLTGLVIRREPGLYIFSSFPGRGEGQEEASPAADINISSLSVDDNHFHMRFSAAPADTGLRVEELTGLRWTIPLPQATPLAGGGFEYKVAIPTGHGASTRRGGYRVTTVPAELNPDDRPAGNSSLLQERIVQGLKERYSTLPALNGQDQADLDSILDSLVNDPGGEQTAWTRRGWVTPANPVPMSLPVNMLPLIWQTADSMHRSATSLGDEQNLGNSVSLEIDHLREANDNAELQWGFNQVIMILERHRALQRQD